MPTRVDFAVPHGPRAAYRPKAMRKRYDFGRAASALPQA
jgi:hypothetical protein